MMFSLMQVLERGADPELLYSVDKLSMDQVRNMLLSTRAQTAAKMRRVTSVIANVTPVTKNPFKCAQSEEPVLSAAIVFRHSLELL
jgi:hypothetical protein